MAASLDDDIDISEESDSDYEDDNILHDDTDIDKSLDAASDILTDKCSIKVESSDIVDIQSVASPQDCGQRMIDIKRRYTRRMSLIELTGIIAESVNSIQRGRIPLVTNLSSNTARENLLHVVVREIEEGNCPIVVKKNGEYLSTADFDESALHHHLSYITKIWKQQSRY
ncbi:RNA polymerase [Sea otter poxvirus]|uniref:DNA-directed RNA polymerase 19 kDa subunit n=1 Tax=Sea otter poxvirus TaxID=1416741 RepID=A0A2U9QHQ8_9POXV|nr:RNA polymerase [Sea otter poxvirus]AWU47139.1 RNA polymerase [Sea otter poxvirus]